MSAPNRLRVIRTERGLSIKTLARHAAVSRQTIYSAESGAREPDIKTLRRLADALDVSLADLLDGEREVLAS